MAVSHMIRLSVPHTEIARSDIREMAASGEAYLDHALVWRLFPGDDSDRDFLFRRMRADHDRRDYLIVAKRLPVPNFADCRCDCKAYDPAPSVGTRLRFDLRANPTIARKRAGRSSQRHDVLADAWYRSSPDNPAERSRPPLEIARDWLLQRSMQMGLQIDPDALMVKNYIQHRLRRHDRTIQFSSVDFSGIACVTDTEKIADALKRGIGHAKGFGCGLLLVRRAD